MNKNQAVKMSEELMLAAEKIAKKYNMSVKRGSGKYDADSYKMNNITFFEVECSDSGNIDDQFTPSEFRSMRVNFDMRKNHYGLENVEVGQAYCDDQGRNMKIIGWKSRNRKFPVLVQNIQDGSYFKVAPQHLKQEMNLK